MLSELLARADRALRPALTLLPPYLTTLVYSSARNAFLRQFTREHPHPTPVPSELSRTLWGIHFRSGLFNAAGIFKNGDGVETCFRQGAGAYLAGTTTTYPRTGNTRDGIAKPFAPYPRSGAASNWLGLPNDGHAAVAKRLAGIEHRHGFPIGASLMTAPESHGLQAQQELVVGMNLYEQAGVHFLEINESCPNVVHGDSTLEAIAERLDYVRREFLLQRKRLLPVIVKFSTDTALEDAPRLMEMLVDFGFDGVNFGNTSTRYAAHRTAIAPQEQALYDQFTGRFGGGVSGKPLRHSSLALVRAAREWLDVRRATSAVPHEFHIISTGGISSAADVQASEAAGAGLCQWYTGYFEEFAQHGHRVYERLYAELTKLAALAAKPQPSAHVH
jgi:dihydroorotate dehydrogenase